MRHKLLIATSVLTLSNWAMSCIADISGTGIAIQGFASCYIQAEDAVCSGPDSFVNAPSGGNSVSLLGDANASGSAINASGSSQSFAQGQQLTYSYLVQASGNVSISADAFTDSPEVEVIVDAFSQSYAFTEIYADVDSLLTFDAAVNSFGLTYLEDSIEVQDYLYVQLVDATTGVGLFRLDGVGITSPISVTQMFYLTAGHNYHISGYAAVYGRVAAQGFDMSDSDFEVAVWSYSAHLQPVPIPAAGWLLVSGLGLLGIGGKRRVRKVLH